MFKVLTRYEKHKFSFFRIKKNNLVYLWLAILGRAGHKPTSSVQTFVAKY